jgi:peptidoglycan/LPS O-acetylase OafA/YrhL
MIDLSRSTTDVLRGIAIIAILINHLVLQDVIIGQFGVALFLLISGYCLARRYGLEGIDARHYLWQRVKRVAVPCWAVLTGIILGMLVFKPSLSTFPNLQQAITLNYLLIFFKPYDLLSVGWFITYICAWYVAYLIASKLPISAYFKWASLVILPGILSLATPSLLAFMTGTFPGFDPGPFHFTYIPYAFCFPIGVAMALQSRLIYQIDIKFKLLNFIGENAYWIYLLHAPVVVGLKYVR